MALNFEKYVQDGNAFINELAANLGQPEAKSQTGVLLRSVLHVLRDRITISESLHLLAQLPPFLKALYVENWKYQEQPDQIDSLDQFIRAVDNEQAMLGLADYDWGKPKDEIIRTVINTLGRYWAEGQLEDVVAQLPPDIQALFEIKIRGQAASGS